MLILCQAASGKGKPVYRCPGPPLVYTDELTRVEARARNCKPVAPDRWVEIERNTEVLVSVDAETIVRDGQFLRTWVKYNYSRPRSSNAKGHAHFTSEIELLEINCRNRSVSRLEFIRYAASDQTGPIVEEAIVPASKRGARRAVPDSFEEHVLLSACEVQRQ